ncbi:kinesin-like protein KIN-10C isoform X1 [Cucumis sativus]|uniref:kinesin-like protein KIN-10C isoform X1 n=1 Tax=Cucumis sativus TaxID=3659 RepID=UPI0005EC1461|nr:kinesin-like protein KIN-10C isoform X1 [Cucumis sativus]
MDSSSRALKGFKEGRKVRVIAKIKSLPGQEIDGESTASWISVNKPNGDASESVAISFGDQPVSRKETYEVDYCYEQNEDTENIFTREVKSLIPGVFDGHHATVIAYGARGTGKTSTIQGTIEKQGLASLTINELLLMAKEKGKSVSISYYEVYMDYVYDLLDPKRATVLVLDNGQGKIQLKGLSRIPVKSLSDFHGLYFVGSSSHKQGQKNTNEPPPRSHRGLIVHISSTNETAPDTRFVSKMNFVDMAGYEDARRRSTDGTSLVENSKINKSIYALLNVASALNSNDNHVPYRESKLTRILQDSLGGAQSKILMISCLNSSFCQDSIYMANLAARSCQVIKRVASSAIRKMKSSTNSAVHSSLKSQIPKSVSATAKKQTISRFSFSEKKASVSTTSSAMKGRKLFDDATSYLGKLDKETKLSSASSRRERLKNGGPISVIDQVKPLSCSIKPEEESTSALEKELSVAEISNSVETTIVPEVVSNSKQEPERIDNDMSVLSANGGGQNINEEDNYSMINIDDILVESTPEVTSSTSLFAVQNSCLDKENSSYMINEESSPPISARLQALSNSLKLLCSSTPTCKIPVSDDPYALVSTDAVTEQQTPKMERSLQVYDEEDVANPTTTPWEKLSKRSTGLQKLLVEDLLRFINTASKEELKQLNGIGEKRAAAIIELRKESPEPFNSIDDLMKIGLSAKQVKGLMKKEAGELLFN